MQFTHHNVYALIYLTKFYEWIFRWFLNTWNFTSNPPSPMTDPCILSGPSFEEWRNRAFLNRATEDPYCQPELMCHQKCFLFLILCVSDQLLWNYCLSPPPTPLLLWDDTVYGPSLSSSCPTTMLLWSAPPALSVGATAYQDAVPSSLTIPTLLLKPIFPPDSCFELIFFKVKMRR